MKKPTTEKEAATARIESTALFGFFKVRRTRDGKGWNAWGALERMTADNPITEPADPVHFCFGSSEDGAVQKLTQEMDATYGKRIWWRQEAVPHV